MKTPSRDPRLREHLWVLRAQMGDREAFTSLHQQYNSKLLYYLRRLMSPPAIAEDTLQEVWLTVVRKVASIDHPEAFKTWLYRIAHNRAMTRLKRERQNVPLEDLPPDREIDPDSKEEAESSFAEWDVREVHRALGQLSTAHREVLTLRFVGELSYEEIANIVGCQLGTIRSRIYYAKKSLHGRLESGREDSKKEGKND